ncbi:toxin-antitoxin system YwqK family antitoxin [Alphaproteobacteria bacterium]|nr:toxin-antitoxin system YwqK family antitoxin [Alphaproteobacteria bacterium]
MLKENMKKLSVLFLIFTVMLPSISWGLSMDDLVKRDGLWYKKFTDIPFTGKIDEGIDRGSINNGKAQGSWVIYFGDGQLKRKVNFKDGNLHGSYVSYHDNGQLFLKGNYENGKQEGYWERYYPNGQSSDKGVFKNSKKEGYWEGFLKDGTVWRDDTGTFKNGVKVSD